MMGLAILVVCGLAAYLLGSIPTGYLIAKLVRGIDIREHGSGGTGATNVLRNVGKLPALSVLLIDLLKGAAAVWLMRFGYPVLAAQGANPGHHVETLLPWLMTLGGLLALIGHSKSVWIGFKGGKSAASGLGVLLAMVWPVALGVLAIFAAVLALFRMVSLSSIAAAASAVILMALAQQPTPYLLLAIAGGGYVIWRHLSNIQRIFAGTEPRLGDPKPGT